ncbi:MAG: hypothetical protein HKN13_12755 [Rhodothermales bacterium]|nr:hypothetical protein [Rhodothermales bacterium]
MQNSPAPEYNKPSEPGISMNFDNTVSIYHIVRSEDSFAQAVSDTLAAIREANTLYPDWPRMLYLDIVGHRSDGQSGFDDDFTEFQQELFFSTMAPFLTAFELPLTGPLLNPQPQRNDLPDEIVIK